MMKRYVVRVTLFGLILAMMAGCASTPVASGATPVTVFEQPIVQVQKAAVDALVVTGFDVAKQELTYVEGFRPRKIGLFVGSGGETVGIWLTEQGPNQTAVKVDTTRSLLGIVGQKIWNTDIINEMTKSLTK